MGESGLLGRILGASGALRSPGAGLLVGPGDDAAVWQPPAGRAVVLTQDVLVEGVDFRRDWTTPYRLGRRCVTVSLSDLAAMGAEPAFCLVTLCAPADTPLADVEALHGGIEEIAASYGCPLVGGDVSAIEGPLVIDVVAGGVVVPDRVLRRDAGRAGDMLVVTGRLGSAAAGLRLLQSAGASGERDLLGDVPPVAEGQHLGGSVLPGDAPVSPHRDVPPVADERRLAGDVLPGEARVSSGHDARPGTDERRLAGDVPPGDARVSSGHDAPPVADERRLAGDVLPGDVRVPAHSDAPPAAEEQRLAADFSPEHSWLSAQLDPVPRLAEGQRLAAAGVRCAGDLSDGVLVDARRTADASGCAAELWRDALPVDPALRHRFADDWLALAVGGGEDFELLAAVEPGDLAALLRDWPPRLAPLTVVGRLVAGSGVRLLDREGGTELALPPVASRHFGS